MQIRKTTKADFQTVLTLYEAARKFMRENGNPDQWGTTYPSAEQVEKDIETGRSYVCEEEGELLGTFYFAVEEDPVYRVIEEGSWLTDGPYGVMHRVAAPGAQRGVASFCIEWCFEQSGRDLRIDTYQDNIPMQNLLAKRGFTRCGIVHMPDDGSPRIAYEKCSEMHEL